MAPAVFAFSAHDLPTPDEVIGAIWFQLEILICLKTLFRNWSLAIGHCHQISFNFQGWGPLGSLGRRQQRLVQLQTPGFYLFDNKHPPPLILDVP